MARHVDDVDTDSLFVQGIHVEEISANKSTGAKQPVHIHERTLVLGRQHTRQGGGGLFESSFQSGIGGFQGVLKPDQTLSRLP